MVGQRGRRRLDREIFGFLLILYLECVIYLEFGFKCKEQLIFIVKPNM